jgi:hypothetical protein
MGGIQTRYPSLNLFQPTASWPPSSAVPSPANSTLTGLQQADSISYPLVAGVVVIGTTALAAAIGGGIYLNSRDKSAEKKTNSAQDSPQTPGRSAVAFKLPVNVPPSPPVNILPPQSTPGSQSVPPPPAPVPQRQLTLPPPSPPAPKHEATIDPGAEVLPPSLPPKRELTIDLGEEVTERQAASPPLVPKREVTPPPPPFVPEPKATPPSPALVVERPAAPLPPAPVAEHQTVPPPGALVAEEVSLPPFTPAPPELGHSQQTPCFKLPTPPPSRQGTPTPASTEELPQVLQQLEPTLVSPKDRLLPQSEPSPPTPQRPPTTQRAQKPWPQFESPLPSPKETPPTLPLELTPVSNEQIPPLQSTSSLLLAPQPLPQGQIHSNKVLRGKVDKYNVYREEQEEGDGLCGLCAFNTVQYHIFGEDPSFEDKIITVEEFKKQIPGKGSYIIQLEHFANKNGLTLKTHIMAELDRADIEEINNATAFMIEDDVIARRVITFHELSSAPSPEFIATPNREHVATWRP